MHPLLAFLFHFLLNYFLFFHIQIFVSECALGTTEIRTKGELESKCLAFPMSIEKWKIENGNQQRLLT